jgi:ABC-2 type transport system ATP-binding protein
MIQATNLFKSYGSVRALGGVSFSITPGEIVGLLGPNGAGKTTIIKILTGYLQPDVGVVLVDRLDVLSHPLEVQTRIGYLPENAPLYPELSVQAYLKMMAELRQIPTEDMTARISEAVYAVGLEQHLTRRIGHLSKGFRQRVGLAQAILHQPKLLILDEPTVGLDPTQVLEIRKLIKRLAQQSTILFSSHILSEVEAVCDRVMILINGEIKADARLEELAKTTDSLLVLRQDVPEVTRVLEELEGVTGVEMLSSENGKTTYRIKGILDEGVNQEVFALAQERDWPLQELKYDTRTLESVFSELAVAV